MAVPVIPTSAEGNFEFKTSTSPYIKIYFNTFPNNKKNNQLNFLCNSFRFSDPCLLNPSDNDSKISGQNTPDRRNNIPSDTEQNNKFFSVLMEQIQLLHETNTKICRDLHEAKGK